MDGFAFGSVGSAGDDWREPARPRFPVHLVDDDEAMCRTIERVLRHSGYPVRSYTRGASFLADLDPVQPASIILDLCLPDMSGLEILRTMKDRGVRLPILILTGHGDVPSAVRALKDGATDFLQKPFRAEALERAIEASQLGLVDALGEAERRDRSRAKLACLSAREAETLDQLRQGLQHKTIAHNLGISVRTVEEHRSRILKKLGVRSLAEVLEALLSAG
jgi:two-component system response regulator FixJ